MNAVMAATIAMTLDRLENIHLAVMMNALSGFGRIDKANLAYTVALEHELIKESGLPTFDLEDTLAALDVVIRNRNYFGIEVPK